MAHSDICCGRPEACHMQHCVYKKRRADVAAAGLGHRAYVVGGAQHPAVDAESAARKNVPLATGVLDYFPLALMELARLAKTGNDKHNPGQPLHWSREKSSDHADCILRHMVDRGTKDTDGFLHDTKVAWRALAQLQIALERWQASAERIAANADIYETRMCPEAPVGISGGMR